MKSINIKGKEYVPVNERVKEFKVTHPTWKLIAEIVSLTDTSVVMKAEVFDENGVLMGRGYASEDRNASNINKTSYIENCETSAWGRALGNIGIGIDASIASADEVQNAVIMQETLTKPVTKNNIDALISKCIDAGVGEQTILETYKVSKFEDMNQDQWINAMRRLDKTIKKNED